MIDKQVKARDIAVMALRDHGGNVSARLDHLLDQHHPAPADRALARELALGTVRRRGTLNAVLKAFLKCPERPMPGALQEILQVALYQMLFLDRVPDFAAVGEAVEQAGRFRHKRQAGLVNGVLRSIARDLSGPERSGATFARNAVPIAGDVSRTTTTAIFPDPLADPAGYLAEAYSLPPVLAERWVRRFGGLARAAEIAEHANTRPPLILRVNRLKTDPRAAADALADAGVRTVPHVNGVSLVAEKRVNVRELAAFRDGWVQPQDATGTHVVLAANPKPGMRVLDFCAAPGTKTTHLAELMDNSGEIVAVDVSDDKLARITENCRRMGVDIVTSILSEQVGSLIPRSFDLALVDVPCSNTGVLARRAEARWRFDEEGLGGLVRDQRSLTELAVEFVRPEGTLAYSTCSTEPEECEGVIKSLLAGRPNLVLVREESILPGGADDPARWCDGGYLAILAVR